jgi:hypothetical protein
MDADLGAEHEMEEDVQSPITARDIVKSEAWADFLVEHEMEDTAGLEDPFNDAPADAALIKGEGKAVAYTIPDIREPVAAESQEGRSDAKRDLP